MPKRFIETDFFKHPFIRGLKAPYKMLYAFIFLDCDNSGIWNPEFEIASIYLDQKVDLKSAQNNFKGKFICLENGKWFFPDFIQHQYPGGLKEKNPAHFKVIENLTKLNFLDENKQLKASLKGLGSSLQATKDKEEEKEEGKGKEKGKEAEPEILVHPFDSKRWLTEWAAWVLFRVEIKKPYKSLRSQQTQLKWFSDNNFSELESIAIINQSIRNQWQGLFELKKNNNGKQSIADDRRKQQDAIIAGTNAMLGRTEA